MTKQHVCMTVSVITQMNIYEIQNNKELYASSMGNYKDILIKMSKGVAASDGYAVVLRSITY